MQNNLEIYENLWSKVSVLPPNIWPFFKISNQYKGKAILEIGCGKIPRAPIEGTHFLDISPEAVDALNKKGGKGVVGNIERMPFDDKQFDLVLAFEILEHIQNDTQALKEIYRVLKDNGLAVIATPLHQKWFTNADTYVGHVRRYEPLELLRKITDAGFTINRFSVSGITPFVYTISFLRNGISFFRKFIGRIAKNKNDQVLSRGASMLIPLIAFFETMRGIAWHQKEQYERETKNRAGVTLALEKKIATIKP